MAEGAAFPERLWRLLDVLDVSAASRGTNSIWFRRVVTKAKSKNGRDKMTTKPTVARA